MHDSTSNPISNQNYTVSAFNPEPLAWLLLFGFPLMMLMLIYMKLGASL